MCTALRKGTGSRHAVGRACFGFVYQLGIHDGKAERSRMEETKGQLERQKCQGWFLNHTNPGLLRSGHLLVMLFPDLVIVLLCI